MIITCNDVHNTFKKQSGSFCSTGSVGSPYYKAIPCKNENITIYKRDVLSSLDGDNLVLFCYFYTSEVWPDMKGTAVLWLFYKQRKLEVSGGQNHLFFCKSLTNGIIRVYRADLLEHSEHVFYIRKKRKIFHCFVENPNYIFC